MRGLSLSCACLLTALAALAGSTAAEADVTLGSVVQPPGSTAGACPTRVALTQLASDPGTPYTVPAGTWKLTRWEVNATGPQVGIEVTLVILHRVSAASYEVLATDTEVMPILPPTDGIASFTPPTPLAVSGGDLLGLYTSAPGPTCSFDAGATPGAATIVELSAPTPPAPGLTLSPTGFTRPPGARLNLAATLEGDQDVAVAASASPADPTVGALAVLGSTVTNRGPEWGPVTFTDTVPAGLSVESAVAGSGTCTTAARTVNCTIEGLAPGQSAPVGVLVTPTAAGSYVNTVSVAPPPGVVDPTSGDDSASARLDVLAAAVPTTPPTTTTPPTNMNPKVSGDGSLTCVVPDLRRVPLPSARRLLGQLGCKTAKVRRTHDRKIPEGTVIRTTPKPGTYAAPRKVGLVVSSGPPRHPHHRHGASKKR